MSFSLVARMSMPLLGAENRGAAVLTALTAGPDRFRCGRHGRRDYTSRIEKHRFHIRRLRGAATARTGCLLRLPRDPKRLTLAQVADHAVQAAGAGIERDTLTWPVSSGAAATRMSPNRARTLPPTPRGKSHHA
ncbi:hypothetical protein SVIO_003830 [Streptomyces violaceusniger]|uniref:Uncharacterized protein n=1 Tax=Streptomyces violaceusniger TaxID=68280 RepID=A0A4D4KT69_STRVO|nr:hypothetical protein SVIO_003830 [Streptomyces violaceusniger]